MTASHPDLSKPSLAGLSYVLRHPEIWPDGFEWNYGNCRTCAMGIAHRLWTLVPDLFFVTPDIWIRATAAKFVLAGEDASRIFGWAGGSRDTQPIGFSQLVTPTDIADLIDAYLAKQADARADRGLAKLIDAALHSPASHSEPPPVYTVERVW